MKTNKKNALKEFVERLQGLIEEREVTITELAREANLDRPALNLLALGKRKGMPRDVTIRRLAHYFGCNFTWLKTGEGDRKGQFSGESVTGFDESLNFTFSQIRQWLLEEQGGTMSTAMDFADEFQAAFPGFKDWKDAQRIIKNPERSGVEPVKE